MTFNSVNGNPNPFGNSGLNFMKDKGTAGRMQQFMGSPEFKVASAAVNEPNEANGLFSLNNFA